MKIFLISTFLIIFNVSLFSESLSLKWSSYFGGSLNEEITKVKADGLGNTYIVGYTESDDYPTTPNAFQRGKRGNYDIFLTKLDKNQNIVWSTYFGGSSREISQNFIVTDNAIWVVGETISSDYPSTNDAVTKYFIGGSGDIIIAKFSLDGDLQYSTYFGGGGYDYAADITEDSEGNVWLTGRTNSSDFNVTNDAAKKSITGAYDTYIIKLSNTGKLLYSSLLGGSLSDYGLSINFSKKLNQVVVVGFTDSDDYPITGNAIQSSKIGTQDEYDGFVSFFNLNTSLEWSSYLGGFGNDFPLNTAFDNDDNLILRFYTTSYNLPVSINAFQKKLKGNINNYLVKISEDKNIVWATYLGGSLTDGADNILHKFGGLSVDKNNNILLTGFTDSKDFPTTKNSFSETNSSLEDSYFSKFDENGVLLYSTYLGGQNNDEGRSITVDGDRIIVTGWTVSYNFPVTNNAYSKKIIGEKDGFISIFQLPQTSCDPVMDSEVGFTKLDLKTNRNIDEDSYAFLTDFKSYDNGYIFSKGKVNISYGFVSNFSFTVSDGVVKIINSELKDNKLQSDNSLPGADGIAFIIAGQLPPKEGESGGGIGYGGMPNSMAIELDLYKNDENYDPNGNHLAIQIPNNFILSPIHNKSNTVFMKDDIFEVVPDSSHNYYCRVEYFNNSLRVYLDTTEDYKAPVAQLDDFVISDYILMDSNRVGFLGLTSSTGRSVEVHKLIHWDICSYNRSSVISGISAFMPDLNLSIFPNPTDDFVNISLPEDRLYKNVKVVISDLLGKIVMQRDMSNIWNTLHLSVQNFEKGLYNCQIILDNQEVYRTQLIRK